MAKCCKNQKQTARILKSILGFKLFKSIQSRCVLVNCLWNVKVPGIDFQYLRSIRHNIICDLFKRYIRVNYTSFSMYDHNVDIVKHAHATKT